MSETATTPFSNKAAILAEVWMNFRQDEEFADFIEYNDVGLPLAYCVAEGIVPATDKAKRFIEESFDVLIAGLDIEDEGFSTMEEVLDHAEGSKKLAE